jgi:GTP cyclohydrolase I
MSIDKEMLDHNEMDGYSKIDQYNPELLKNISEHYAAIINNIGEDATREGLLSCTVTTSTLRQFCARQCSAMITSRW